MGQQRNPKITTGYTKPLRYKKGSPEGDESLVEELQRIYDLAEEAKASGYVGRDITHSTSPERRRRWGW